MKSIYLGSAKLYVNILIDSHIELRKSFEYFQWIIIYIIVCGGGRGKSECLSWVCGVRYTVGRSFTKVGIYIYIYISDISATIFITLLCIV